MGGLFQPLNLLLEAAESAGLLLQAPREFLRMGTRTSANYNAARQHLDQTETNLRQTIGLSRRPEELDNVGFLPLAACPPLVAPFNRGSLGFLSEAFDDRQFLLGGCHGITSKRRWGLTVAGLLTHRHIARRNRGINIH